MRCQHCIFWQGTARDDLAACGLSPVGRTAFSYSCPQFEAGEPSLAAQQPGVACPHCKLPSGRQTTPWGHHVCGSCGGMWQT